MELVRRARFSGSFVFKYSPRPGTSAAKRFPDDVPTAEKRRRNQELLALVEEITGEENRNFVGRTVRVFVEELSPGGNVGRGAPRLSSINPQLRGRTTCNRIVVFDGPESLVGQEVDVGIVGSSPLTLFGAASPHSGLDTSAGLP
jgi:tRNA-2-methylthio-N6-dimethylallyladenosine synthase